MGESAEFLEFIERVRAGDEDAATELVRLYEPEIRREVRIRLTDPDLRRVLDSMDICQSVLGAFFARAALGQFDLQDPRQLLRLLVTMARNRVIYWGRKQHAQRRDVRRDQTLGGTTSGEFEPVAAGPTPSQEVLGRELLEEFRRRLSDEERQLADRRAAGYDWARIAAELGGSPEALRKRMARALNRVSAELGLEQVEDE